jgi:type I restriction enzyme S subunit
MENWKQKKLFEICEVNPETRNRNWLHSEIEYIDISSVGTGQLIESPKRLSLEHAPSRAQRIVRKGDIIVSTVRPNRRSFLYLKETKPETIASTGFVVLRAKENNDSRFLYYLVTSQEFTDYLVSKAEGSAYPAVNPNVFSNADVLVPDYEEQKAIAKILSSLDDKIELNRRMNETLEAIARALFKAWFVDFEPIRANMENRPSESASPEITKLFPSEFENGIPKGWTITKFGELFSLVVDNRGKTPPLSSDGYKLLEGYQIFCDKPFPDFSNSEKQKFVSEEVFNSLKWFRTKHPQYLDILCATVGTLPKWCFAPSQVDFGIAQNVVALRTNKELASPYFAKCLMNTDNFLWNFNSRIVTTAQPSIKVGPLKDILIILPTKSLIIEFDKIAQPIYSHLQQIFNQSQTLAEIRDSLIPRLISGKIPVSKIEGEG